MKTESSAESCRRQPQKLLLLLWASPLGEGEVLTLCPPLSGSHQETVVLSPADSGSQGPFSIATTLRVKGRGNLPESRR